MSTLYARIKQRREDLGMSQSELADCLGYGDRSTIAKIESGVNDLTQTKILAFAEALHTTPAYLMGWVDDPYNYELDEDDRMVEIPIAIHEALMEQYNSDLRQVWYAWLRYEEDAAHEAATMDIPNENVNLNRATGTPLTRKKNKLKIAGRDGSYEERTLTDDQMEALRAFIKLMPDASDDL